MHGDGAGRKLSGYIRLGGLIMLNTVLLWGLVGCTPGMPRFGVLKPGGPATDAWPGSPPIIVGVGGPGMGCGQEPRRGLGGWGGGGDFRPCSFAGKRKMLLGAPRPADAHDAGGCFGNVACGVEWEGLGAE